MVTVSRESKVVRNSAILAAQHIIINLIAIVVVGYIARKLGKQDYGVFALAFGFPAIFEFIGTLGLRPLIIREIARDKDKSLEFLGKVIPAQAVLIVLMTIFILISAKVLNYENRIIYAIIIAAGSTVCEQFSRIILDFFQAFEEMGKVALRDVTVRVFTAVASVSVILLGYGLYAVCLVYFAGSLLGLLINIWLFRRRFGFPRMELDLVFLRVIFKEGSSYIFIGFAASLSPKIDILLISKMADTSSLGIYCASLNLFSKLNFMSDTIATASFPAMSELFWTDREKANNIFNKALLTIILLALPVAVGGFMVSKQLITLIYGSSYNETVKVFSIMVCSVPLMFVNTLLHSSLCAVKQQNFVAKINLTGVAVSFIANVICIKLLGYIGAAVAKLITQLVWFVLGTYGSRNYFKLNLGAKTIQSILFSLIFLGGVTYVTIPFGIFVTIPLAVAVYYMCLKVSGLSQNIRVAR